MFLYHLLLPRIHLVAGPLSCPMDWSNTEWQQAKATYLNNVKYAGEHCSKVKNTMNNLSFNSILLEGLTN